MAYFNHAFHKVFLGTGTTVAGLPFTAPNGFITDVAGVTTADLTGPNVPAPSSPSYTGGYFGIFDAKTYTVFNTSGAGCCPFIIASTPLMTNDKIGPYAGGYRESNKSKMINPKYVRQFYYVAPCEPQQAVVSVGTTPGVTNAGAYANACAALAGGFLNENNFQSGTACGGCCKEYLCGETYYLRIDVKGSPALRFLNHQAYQTLSAYTGCCSGPAPTAVDPTLVYLAWAKALVINPYMKDLIAPVVFDYTGQAWYAPGTTVTYDGTSTAVTEGQWWTSADGVDQYAASPQAAAWTDECTAGMRLYGAYVETRFGNCTFQVTDFFEKEPVKILASMVDYTGDPCTFEGVCVYTECYGVQGMGFGEQVLRDLIVSQSYLQNYVGSGMDFRIREITQGYDIINSVQRTGFYGRYYILHSVPRYNNPTGVFDNDQYMLEIITNGEIGAFNTAMDNLLTSCADCASLERYICTHCEIVPDAVVL